MDTSASPRAEHDSSNHERPVAIEGPPERGGANMCAVERVCLLTNRAYAATRLRPVCLAR